MFKKVIKSLGVALTTSAGLFFSFSSHAAWVTVSGSNFDISYDSAAVGAYGTPLILGNTIVFTPTDMHVDFDTFFDGDGDSSWTTSVLVTPHGSFAPTQLTLAERGDYSFGSFPLPGGAQADFEVDARLFISSESDPIGSFDFLEANYSFSETEFTTLALWNFEESFSIADFSSGFLLTIQNTLFFDVTQGPVFFQKKFVGVQLGGQAAVPVPGALWLMGSALISLGVFRRKK